MTLNLLQNFNTSDLFSLGLGLTLFSYSMYCLITQTIPLGYKTINLFSSDNLENNAEQTNFSSEDIESENSFNLENISTTSGETVKPYSTQEQSVNTDGTNLVDSIVNTDGTNLVESSIQTEDKMLYDYLRELLYNNATPTTSLGEISPTDFVRDYRNDPALASYFEKTANWVDSISRQSSGTSANTEVLFMRKINEDLKSITDLIQNNLTSEEVAPVTKILSPHNTELFPTYDGWLNEIFSKIFNLQDKITDIEQLRKLMDLYSVVPNEIFNPDYISLLIIQGASRGF